MATRDGETFTRSASELPGHSFKMEGPGGIRTHDLVVYNDVVPRAFATKVLMRDLNLVCVAGDKVSDVTVNMV